MERRRSVLAFALGAGLFLLTPAAWSQSSISGTIKDPSGAAMPGVSVEVTSPALIEKSRSVTTDTSGRFNVIDLRPGGYAVKATAPGFKTYKEDNIDVPANTAVPLFIDMAVGSTGDTITVQAEAVAVDVENATHQQVLTREIQDAVPAPRNMQALAALVPGVRLRSGTGANPDVGGSQQMEQTYIIGHGYGAVHTTVLIDGMNINSNYLDGTIQNYVDNSIIQQATYQTSGVGAEVSAGGVLVNQIPKDGGNKFHGDAFLGGTGAGGWWQANNINDALRARGVTSGNAIVHIEDFNGAVGGPIKTDKLWFLGSYRYQSTFDTVPNIFYPDGTPGVEDQHIAQGVLRLSYQIDTKDKFSGTFDRIQKFKGHELSPLAVIPNNPNESAGRRGGTNYYVGQAKWSRIQSARMLLEAGFSTDSIYFSTIYLRPDEAFTPFTAAWLAGASHVNSLASGIQTRSNAPPIQTYNLPVRRNLMGAVSYVTGSHNIKVGIQDAWGKNDRVQSLNADLYQNYTTNSTGVLTPSTVTVFPTPVAIRQHVAADLGVYATDTWKYKRLAITGGIRFEYDKGVIDASTVPGGRFVGARDFARQDCGTIPGLGCWKTWSPRIGAAYDVFGNGRTAVRASWGQYNRPQATEYLNAFNPMFAPSETRTWTDTNKDDIAQDSELGASPNGANFGKLTSTPKLDPNFKRESNRQYALGVQHQLHARMTVGVNYFHRTAQNFAFLQNRAIDSTADYAPFQITNPYDSANPITAYRLLRAPAANDFYQTNADSSKALDIYSGVEFGANMRLPRNGILFGGWTVERQSIVRCDMNIGATNLGIGGAINGSNIINGTYNDPNSLRFCDERGQIPFRSDFKIAGSYPVYKGIDVSWAWNSSPNIERYTTWSVTRATRYPTDCAACPNDAAGVTTANPGGKALVLNGVTTIAQQASITIPLLNPGGRFQDRLNQLDLGIKRTFKFREQLRLQAQLDVFNVMNANIVLVQGQNLTSLATALGPDGVGGQPTQILQARLLRLAVQFHF